MAWMTWLQIAPRFDAVLRRRGRDVLAKSVGLYSFQFLLGFSVAALGLEAMRDGDASKGLNAVGLGGLLLLVLGVEWWIKLRSSREEERLETEEKGDVNTRGL